MESFIYLDFDLKEGCVIPRRKQNRVKNLDKQFVKNYHKV
jgi:hypothetical protein